MTQRLYHYAVFLRCSTGTVRRNVAVSKRSIKLASKTASDAVARHLREQVTVLDAVPLRERKGKATRVLKSRSRRPVTVNHVSYVLARRPKARQSVVLTRRGTKPYASATPAWDEPHVPASAKVSESRGTKRDEHACANSRCIKRGHCGHKRNVGVDLLTWETKIKVGTATLVLRCLAQDADTARRLLRETLSAKGLGHKRITRLYTNIAAAPERL